MSDLGLQFTETQAPRITDKTLWHVGVSGGKDSQTVLQWVLSQPHIPKARVHATFCDTGNEHNWTYGHIEWMSKNIHPIETINPELKYFELALSRRRFPGVKSRFCTEALKITPTQEHIARLKLEWRPLLTWTLQDVLDYNAVRGTPLNPLYAIGAARVGCWPCIMSRKDEIRTIALKFPERIDQIREMEQTFLKQFGRYSTFFPMDKVPERFRTLPYRNEEGKLFMVPSIDDVVRWSLTGDRAQGSYLDDDKAVKENPMSCSSGFCE